MNLDFIQPCNSVCMYVCMYVQAAPFTWKLVDVCHLAIYSLHACHCS